MLEQHRWENWVAHWQLWKSHPMQEALNTHEGGYVLAIAFFLLLPLLRSCMRAIIWEVKRAALAERSVSYTFSYSAACNPDHVSMQPWGKRLLFGDYKRTDKAEDQSLLLKWNGEMRCSYNDGINLSIQQ